MRDSLWNVLPIFDRLWRHDESVRMSSMHTYNHDENRWQRREPDYLDGIRTAIQLTQDVLGLSDADLEELHDTYEQGRQQEAECAAERRNEEALYGYAVCIE